MAKTASLMVPLNTQAPPFCLPDVISGKHISLENKQAYVGSVIMFICNHCPYVKHINKGLTQLANDYLHQGIRFMAINSNDIENYPEDSPEKMQAIAVKEQYPFPYLFDETQEIAQAYHAACTPDFFIYNADLKLIYRGQFDDSRPGNDIPVSGNSIRQVLDCLLTSQPIPEIQKPSLGCNIKWKM